MTVLVTGAGGFVGSHVARLLRDRGERVRGLDLAWPPAEAEDAGLDRLTGSILDEEVLARAVADVDCVIHCAALAHLWQARPVDYDLVNVLGTCRVASAARRVGARLVHVSSYTTLIGETPPDIVDESVEVPPSRLLGRYPRSKRQGELAALSVAAAGVPVTVVLPTAPVGPGDHRLTPPTGMIRDLATGSLPALLDCRLNLIDVRALAEGIVAARDRGRSGARYLLAGQDIALSDLAGRISALTGARVPRARVPLWLALAAARAEAALSRVTGRAPSAPLTGVRLAARPVTLDPRRAREELGFAPPGIDDALAASLDWLRKTGHLPAG